MIVPEVVTGVLPIESVELGLDTPTEVTVPLVGVIQRVEVPLEDRTCPVVPVALMESRKSLFKYSLVVVALITLRKSKYSVLDEVTTKVLEEVLFRAPAPFPTRRDEVAKVLLPVHPAGTEHGPMADT